MNTFASRGIRLVGAALLLVVVAAALVLFGSSPSSAESFPVTGTFILWDDFPTVGTGELCDAKRSFYHDINRDTEIQAETVDGAILAMTTLGDGRIVSAAEFLDVANAGGAGFDAAEVEDLIAQVGLQPCVFHFSFEIESGSDGGSGYVVLLGRRGRWELSEASLRETETLQLSIGLR